MKYTHEEMEYKTDSFVHDLLGDYAFLKYVDRVEIWKMNIDGFYEHHRTVDNQKMVENVFKIKL